MRIDIQNEINKQDYLEYYKDVLRDYDYIQSVLDKHLMDQTVGGALIDEIIDFDIDADNINDYSIDYDLNRKEIYVNNHWEHQRKDIERQQSAICGNKLIYGLLSPHFEAFSVVKRSYTHRQR